jgi:hypothetical protein
VLGHLVVSLDFMRMLMGDSVDFDPRRMAAFGPGSKADAPLPRGVDRGVLLTEYREKFTRIRELATRVDPAVLAKPFPNPIFEGTAIQTAGHIVLNLLTAHIGMHLGQLSVYRRACGKAAMF